MLCHIDVILLHSNRSFAAEAQPQVLAWSRVTETEVLKVEKGLAVVRIPVAARTCREDGTIILRW